jgi:four helix bundle protein
MTERTELIAKAAAWMQARGWQRKLAKKRGREQSLFEHRRQASDFGRSPMSRDPTKLKVFHLADESAVQVYRVTRSFPVEERYGLQGQLRRAAVSVPTNIVEGSRGIRRRTFCTSSTWPSRRPRRLRYLLGLCARLGILRRAEEEPLVGRYDDLIRGLQKLLSVLRHPKPGA